MAALLIDSIARGRRRHVWMSASADLIRDASRDLNDLQCTAALITLKDLDRVGSMNMPGAAILFITYKALITKRGKKQSRFQQIVSWLAGKQPGLYDGCIIFDEAHKAKAFNLADMSEDAGIAGHARFQ